MTTYTTELWGDTHRMAANFAEASCPIQFEDEDGNWIGNGKQVADYRHHPSAAMRDYLEELARMSGADLAEDEDVAAAIKGAVDRMTEGDA
jgi:hypothetical protein